MKLIHDIYSMSVGRYGQLDQNNDISLFKTKWNPLPVSWFNTEKFFTQYSGLFGFSNNSDLRNEVSRFLMHNKIIMLDRIMKTLLVLMKNQNDRSLFGLILKGNVKNYDGNFDYYIEKVKQLTGIQIKDGDDLKKLQYEVSRLLNKYLERFGNKKPIIKEKTKFIDFALSVFSIMDMTYVSEMKLAEFSRLKILADKRIAAQEKSKRR